MITVLRRGFLYYLRRPMKTVLLCIMLSALLIFLAFSLVLYEGSRRSQQMLYNSFLTIASLNLDVSSIDYYLDIPKLQQSNIDLIANLPQVSDVYYIYSITLPNHDQVGAPLTSSSMQVPLPFKQGFCQMLSGRYFTEDEIRDGKHVIIISAEEAKRLGVEVGDSLQYVYDVATLPEYDLTYKDSDIHQLDVEVIGLFDNLPHSKTFRGAFIPYHLARDIGIEIDASFMKSLNQDRELEDIRSELYTMPPLVNFVLKGPQYIVPFHEASLAYLNNTHYMTYNADGFDEVEMPIKNFTSVMRSTLILSVFVFTIVFILLELMILNQRKKEFAIILAMGERKHRLYGQLLAEICIAVFITAAPSFLLAVNLARVLSQRQLNQMNLTELINESGLQVKVSIVDSLINSYQVTIRLETVIVYIGLVLAGILIVFLLSVIKMRTANPRKMFMDGEL